MFDKRKKIERPMIKKKQVTVWEMKEDTLKKKKGKWTETKTCWEIASNSNCGLENQLSFLIEEGKINLGFLVVEEKSIPWCEGNLFLVKKIMYS